MTQSTQVRPRRSVLYMPGSNTRALEKGRTISADCLILDLEDAVAPDAKVDARNNIVAALSEGGYGTREIVVRVNALDTEWGADDIKAIAAAGPDAILVPKVSTSQDVEVATAAIKAAGGDQSIDLWVMIETALGVMNTLAIAQASRESGSILRAFVLGTNDIAKETRAQLLPGRAAFVGWLASAVASARAYQLDVLDGVFNDFRNLEGFEQEARQGVELGMDGKTLIHPGQVEPCNQIFSPDADEVAWARTILDAFAQPENQGLGVITIDGKMVELLHAEMAKRTVAIADAIEQRG